MSKRMSWGLGVLIVLVITGVSYMFAVQSAKIQQLKKDAAVAEKLLEDSNKHQNQEPDVGNKPPGPAQAGFEWEWHGDHWCEVPVAQSDARHETPESEEIVFEPFELKSDLPDELPAKFPTDAELQKMNAIDIIHLIRLYKEEVRTLRETDYEAGTRLREATIPKLGARLSELDEEANVRRKEWNRRSMERAGFYPATDEVPAKTITVISPGEEYESEESEGGSQ